MDGSLGLQTGSLMFQMQRFPLLDDSVRPVGSNVGCWCTASVGANEFGDTIPVPVTRNDRRPLQRLVDLYLVDPASSHMLVPKTKPCMSELKP